MLHHPTSEHQCRGVASGSSGDTRPGTQALRAHQRTLFRDVKTRFKQKFRPKYT